MEGGARERLKFTPPPPLFHPSPTFAPERGAKGLDCEPLSAVRPLQMSCDTHHPSQWAVES